MALSFKPVQGHKIHKRAANGGARRKRRSAVLIDLLVTVAENAFGAGHTPCIWSQKAQQNIAQRAFSRTARACDTMISPG